MKMWGLFFCYLIAGDDSSHSREYAGEEVLTIKHEEGNIQSYFNMSKIQLMIDRLFEIVESFLIRKEEVMQGRYTPKYHLFLKKA